MPSPTIKEVAKLSGVGVGTVSRVLNNSPQISEATKQKVLKAIEELHYVPNIAGKRLSQKRSYVIAIIVPVIDHPFFAHLIAELELAADKHGYSLLVVSSQHRIEREQEILKRLSQNEADGALFVTHYAHDPKDFKNLAIVSIDRHLADNIPIVTTNNYEATKQGVEYLISKGCKKIAFLGTKPSESSEVFKRAEAYLDTMKAHNMESIIINKNVNHGEEEKIIDELLENYEGVDGIFVSGCILSYIVCNKLVKKNLKIPQDVQVVSYDGEFVKNHGRRITTLEQPLHQMAEKSVELLIKLINKEPIHEKINKFDCRLVIGDTTK